MSARTKPMPGHEFEAIRPRSGLVIHLEAPEPEGHGWDYAEGLTNQGLIEEHVRAHDEWRADWKEPPPHTPAEHKGEDA